MSVFFGGFVMRASGEATLRFYEQIGLTLQQEQHECGPVHHAHMGSEAVLEIYPPSTVGDTIILYTLSLDDMEKHLTQLGIVFKRGRVSIILTDPDGRRVMIAERLP